MNQSNNILLILDLDETLIHARETPLELNPDFVYADYSVYKRPHLETFLLEMYSLFDLAIWSSADDRYVQDLVERIQPTGVEFQFIWGRSRCSLRRNYELDTYVHEKHLKKVKKRGFPLEKILIVDDSPEKTRDNFGNAIYIQPFEGNTEDQELLFLADFLKSIQHKENVRTFEKRGWRSQLL